MDAVLVTFYQDHDGIMAGNKACTILRWIHGERDRGLVWIGSFMEKKEASKVVALMQAKLTPNQTGRKARQGKMQGAAA